MTSAMATSRAREIWWARFAACSRPIRPTPIRPMFRTLVPGTLLEEGALARAIDLPVAPRLFNRVTFADFGDRHVPPALIAGHANQTVVLNVNHGGPVVSPRGPE